jgi:lipopolysaccharide export system protein LptC
VAVGASTAHGVGMTANNATRQIELGGRGTMTMPAKAAH